MFDVCMVPLAFAKVQVILAESGVEKVTLYVDPVLTLVLKVKLPSAETVVESEPLERVTLVFESRPETAPPSVNSPTVSVDAVVAGDRVKIRKILKNSIGFRLSDGTLQESANKDKSM